MPLPEQTRSIYNQISECRLEKTLRNVTSHHRIQGSHGYHEAAVFCRDRLRENQISANILKYPAKEGVYFQNSPSFDFWECRKAWCRLTETGELLADFSENPYSLIQRSGPWLDSTRELEIIELDCGIREEDYAGIDFTGKLVFVHEEYASVRDWAIEKRGAIGYITDYVEPEPGVRDRTSMHNIQKYTSFWWRPGQKHVFGFVLSPDAGDRLHALCQTMAQEGRRPTVTCYVDSELREGDLEVVTGLLPGTAKDEILLCAHLCHPLGSANDNASGVTAVLEALVTLKTMLDQGLLPPLRRSIRMILVPEIIGTYAYLDGLTVSEREQIRLALTLDMVGGKQEGRGPLTLFETPHCTPSIGNSLAIAILGELRRDVPALNASDHIALFHSAVNQYIDGSDHAVLNDPLLDISSPLLCQWPDKTYHTSADTPEVIDYNLLHHACALAAAYGYHAANLSLDDFPRLAQTNFLRMHETMSQLALAAMEDPQKLVGFRGQARDLLAYYCNCIRAFSAQVDSALREESDARIAAEIQRLVQGAGLIVALLAEQLPDEPERPSGGALSAIPVRNFFGRMDYGFSWICATRADRFPAYKDYLDAVGDRYSGDAESSVIYYMDGKRTLGEIASLVSDEYGIDGTELTVAYAKLLDAAGLISWIGGTPND